MQSALCLFFPSVTTLSEHNKNFVMRKSVKAFTDSILDLIVQTDETRSRIVDYYGKPEILYLGPDEQVISQDIEWIVRRAEERGYPTPAAFMSSKPRAGINHKEYGVTSEGVNVFLDVGLRNVLGVNPTDQPFTVSFTRSCLHNSKNARFILIFRVFVYRSNSLVDLMAMSRGTS